MSHSLTEIRCPQPIPKDQFTIIRDLQPVYKFQDYFIVSCKTGYNLMEVRSLLHSLQPYSGFCSVCVSLSPFSKTFFGDFTDGNLLQLLFLPCFYQLSSSGFSFPSSLPCAVTVYEAPVEDKDPRKHWQTRTSLWKDVKSDLKQKLLPASLAILLPGLGKAPDLSQFYGCWLLIPWPAMKNL